MCSPKSVVVFRLIFDIQYNISVLKENTAVKGSLKRINGTGKAILQSVSPFLCTGLSQSTEGPHHGGPGHRTAGHGHPDPSCACSHGGRSPDVDPLDPQNNCGGGTHCPAAGPHTAPHCAAFPGEHI